MKKDSSKKKKTQIENYDEIKDRGKRLEALFNLGNNIMETERRIPLSFNDFLHLASSEPEHVFRDIFQLFYDMVYYYIPNGSDEYEINENTIGFFNYDFTNLFINDCDDPFFADRIFANRFIEFVNRFKKGVQNNHIYLFEGPPGSGKSTFLNNLLYKLEEFTKKPEGAAYKTLWKLDLHKLNGTPFSPSNTNEDQNVNTANADNNLNRYLEITCPNNDHPILQIPKKYRKQFLDELITDKDFKDKLFNSKEYAWIFKENPCCICSSIYNVLMQKLDDPIKVYNMIHVKRSDFSRQFGKGITVFNPGDHHIAKSITDFSLQNKINDLFKNDEVKYIYSHLSNTNNGVFSLMDIKEYNIERLMDLHGIISDGVHKVELIDERIKSIFLGLINPEDKIHYANVKSFHDRIISVKIPYILDYNTEVAIYRNKFGNDIDKAFLPRMLSNFAKIIISSRLNIESTAVKKWIDNPDKYKKFSDKYFLLLRMDIYTGKISKWLSDEDIRKFDFNTRKGVIDESENEGLKGISGRQSLNLFNDFISKYYKSGKPITMDMLKHFFTEDADIIGNEIPDGFIQSIEDMYNWNILQEIKESIYYYNEDQISKDIQNYLYSINFEIEEIL